MATPPATVGSAAPCPICGQPAQPRFKPFCGHRCRLRDLAHWIGGDEPYAIPGRQLFPDEIEALPPPGAAGQDGEP